MPNPSMKLWQLSDGTAVEIRLGETVTFNTEAARRDIGPAGAQAEIFMWHYDYPTLVGMLAIDPEYHEGWNSLDDEVENGRGYWVEMADLVVVSDLVKPRGMVVSKSHKFKDIELKGMECKVLSYIYNTKLAFVEFDKDIGGCSADGLGRRGYCIAVPKNILKVAEVKKAAVKEK